MSTASDATANYYVRSNCLPQQTSLLGMLRLRLLVQSGNLPITDKEKAKEWIGAESFCPDRREAQGFGKIEALSPVFVCREGSSEGRMSEHILLPTARDRCNGQTEGFHLSAERKGRVFFSEQQGAKDFVPELGPHFNYKNGIYEGFLCQQSGHFHAFADVFKPSERIGIQKMKKDEAFYKQLFYKMEQDYSFLFFAQLDCALEDALVYLGGDSSAFKMTVEAIDGAKSPFPDLNGFAKGAYSNNSTDFDKLVLLSDAYTETSIYQHADFALTDTQDFRNLKANIRDTKHYSFRPRENASGHASLTKLDKKINLLKRGSVFYAKQMSGLEKALKHPNFEKIGYNRFIIMPKMQN